MSLPRPLRELLPPRKEVRRPPRTYDQILVPARVVGKPLPVVAVHEGYVPSHWATPEYRQDVPK